MKRAACALALAASLAAPARTSSAQDFEITPFGGYRFGGDFFELLAARPLDIDGAPAFGVAVNVPVGVNVQFEALFTHQSARVLIPGSLFGPPVRPKFTVDHWQAGGLTEFDSGQVRPFLTFDLGLTRYAIDGDSEVRFTMSGGGGVKLFPSEHVGVRLTTQIFATFVDADAHAVACAPGACFLAIDADVVWQIEFSAGLIIRLR